MAKSGGLECRAVISSAPARSATTAMAVERTAIAAICVEAERAWLAGELNEIGLRTALGDIWRVVQP